MKSCLFKRLFIFIILLINIPSHAQSNKSNWFRFPGFGPESPLTLTSEGTFLSVMGAAVLSYTLAEIAFKGDENLNFYQARLGMNNEYFWGFKKVYYQNFGLENRVAPWFAVAVEFNLQQWSDQTPHTSSKNSFGMGLGGMTFYRWYLFGKKRWSPYLEYGAGLFCGFEKFPHNGSQFTFNHSTQVGLEYTLKNKDRIRVGYGQFHQSSHGYIQPDPGYDADGFSVSYSKLWRTSKW